MLSVIFGPWWRFVHSAIALISQMDIRTTNTKEKGTELEGHALRESASNCSSCALLQNTIKRLYSKEGFQEIRMNHYFNL